MRAWPIRGPPKNPNHLTEKPADPTRARLTDEACVFALLTLDAKQRAETYQFDFDARGNPRRNRVPRGPTVIVTQDKVGDLVT